MKKYKIKKNLSYIRDEASVSFHVDSGDYFGTIATVISLISQDIAEKGSCDIQGLLKALKNLEKDLVHLQENYDISPKKQYQSIPKTKNKNKVPKGKLSNQ